MRPIVVRLYEPLEAGGRPLAQMDINPDITALTLTHTLPGGPNTLTVGMEEPERRAGWGASYAFLPQAIRTLPGAHVLVTVGGMDVWEGRLMEDELGPLGVQAFIADGYGIAGANTDYYESTSAVATTTRTILREIIIAAATLINAGSDDQFEDPAVSHTRAEFDQMTLAEALDLVLSEGGNGYVTWDWWLEAGRRLALHPRTAPATPDYVIPYEPGKVTIRNNYRDIISAAKVAYTSSGVEFETAVDVREATVSQYGISRRVRIQADELSSTAAEQLRTAELERRSAPVTAITISRDPDDWLTTASGAPVPHWSVMAGRWLQVADREPQIIVNARFDPLSGLALDLGAPSRQSFATYLAATCTEVNKLVKGVNPKTGGRRRGMRQQAAVGTLTDSTGATPNGVLSALSGTSWNATQRDIVAGNVADLNAQVNLIRDALRSAKILP